MRGKPAGEHLKNGAGAVGKHPRLLSTPALACFLVGMRGLDGSIATTILRSVCSTWTGECALRKRPLRAPRRICG